MNKVKLILFLLLLFPLVLFYFFATIKDKYGYSGSKKCSLCHIYYTKDWKLTPHAQDMQDVKKGEGKVLADLSSSILCQGVDISYTLGVIVTQKYLFHDKKTSNFYILPCEWQIEEKKLEEKYERTDIWQKEAESWQTKCAGCHSLRYQPKEKNYAELGIGCEMCHGPAAWHSRIFNPERIVNFKKMNPLKETFICGQCHLQGGTSADGKYPFAVNYLPSRNLLEKYKPNWKEIKELTEAVLENRDNLDIHQKYMMMNVIEKKSEMRCTDCHDVHKNVHKKHEKISEKETICIICHLPLSKKTKKKWPLRNYKRECNVCDFSSED